MGTYQVRPTKGLGGDNSAPVEYGSWRMQRMLDEGKAVASDTILAFYNYGIYYTPHYLLFGPEELTADYWWSNHDRSYNVLFADGSVKTFSDAGMNLFKQVVDAYSTNSHPVPHQHDFAMAYELYFDPLYAQD